MSSFTNKSLAQTVVTYYNELMTTYKQQEQQLMAKLDNLEKTAGQNKQKGINAAAGDNDAIR